MHSLALHLKSLEFSTVIKFEFNMAKRNYISTLFHVDSGILLSCFFCICQEEFYQYFTYCTLLWNSFQLECSNGAQHAYDFIHIIVQMKCKCTGRSIYYCTQYVIHCSYYRMYYVGKYCMQYVQPRHIYFKSNNDSFAWSLACGTLAWLNNNLPQASKFLAVGVHTTRINGIL